MPIHTFTIKVMEYNSQEPYLLCVINDKTAGTDVYIIIYIVSFHATLGRKRACMVFIAYRCYSAQALHHSPGIEPRYYQKLMIL